MKKIDEQRYLWLFRIFGIFCVISIFLCILLFMSFATIAPSKKQNVFFVSAENNDTDILYIEDIKNKFSIEPGSIGYQIAKNYISEYIVNRESVFNSITKMQQLLGTDSELYYFSSEQVYDDFIHSDEYTNHILNKNKDVVSVIIKKLEFQPNGNYWLADVELKITDSTGTNAKLDMKTIKIACQFLKYQKRQIPNEQWKNPLGFKITKYEYLKN